MVLITDSITPKLYGSDSMKINMTQVSRYVLCDSENSPITNRLNFIYLLIENRPLIDMVLDELNINLPIDQVFPDFDNIVADEFDDVFMVKYDHKNKELTYWECEVENASNS